MKPTSNYLVIDLAGIAMEEEARRRRPTLTPAEEGPSAPPRPPTLPLLPPTATVTLTDLRRDLLSCQAIRILMAHRKGRQ